MTNTTKATPVAAKTTPAETNAVVEREIKAKSKTALGAVNIPHELQVIMDTHESLVLTPPEDAHSMVTKHREKLGLTSIEVGELMGFGARSRVSMSEFENANVKIKPITYTLFALALGFHPAVKAKNAFDTSKQLVYKVNEHKGVDYAAFLQRSLDETGKTVEQVVGIEPGMSAEVIAKKPLSVDLVKGVLDGSVEPTSRQWGLIQLGVDRYVSGFQYPELIREKRLAFNYSQMKFGKLVGCSTQTISNYETFIMLPGDHVWAVIMLALDIHPNYSMVTGNKA